MKRLSRLNLRRCLFLGGILFILQGCKEEALIFPKEENQDIDVTETRPTARPTNLTYVSDFNQNVEIHWPKLSDRVAKAEIKYTDGEEKKVEVTDFAKPTKIHLSELKSYDFSLQYFIADGTPSKVTVTKLLPRPYETDYKLGNMVVDKVDGGVKFIFPNTSGKEFKYVIKYSLNGENKTLESQNAQSDTLIIDKLYDETKETDFNITISDAVLNRSANKLLKSAPGILPYKTLIPSFTYFYNEGSQREILSWKNTIDERVTVKIDYVLNGQTKSMQVSSNKNEEMLIDTDGKLSDLNVTLTGKEGVSASFKGSVFVAKEFADKASWKATVSDNQSDDGGGAAALIDNKTDTYWHSSYGPSVPFPHWFNVDFGKVKLLSKISMLRRGSSTNGFVLYNLETSLDGNAFTTIASNISFDPTSGNWQDYTLPKSVKARYVRVTMTKPKNANDAFTHLGEFSAFGY